MFNALRRGFGQLKGSAKAAMANTILGLQRGTPSLGRIAINGLPVAGSWGGGNQWLLQFSRALRSAGFDVVYDLNAGKVDCIFVLHSSDRLGGTFGLQDIREYKRRNPSVVCVHRVNENDARKGTGYMDDDIRAMNDVADFTVFISDWLRQYHLQKWFPGSRPSAVIHNGADSRIFHPFGARVWKGSGEPFVLATHHWSDHWNKGFSEYRKIDEAIHSGKLSGVELRVIGRWPREIKWKSALLLPPAHGQALAEQLRQAHGYVTASLAEPGGMHFIEGLQCGLPLIFHKGGGGIVEVAHKTGALEFGENPVAAVEQLKLEYTSRRNQLLGTRPSGERMSLEYLELVFSLLGRKGA